MKSKEERLHYIKKAHDFNTNLSKWDRKVIAMQNIDRINDEYKERKVFYDALDYFYDKPYELIDPKKLTKKEKLEISENVIIAFSELYSTDNGIMTTRTMFNQELENVKSVLIMYFNKMLRTADSVDIRLSLVLSRVFNVKPSLANVVAREMGYERHNGSIKKLINGIRNRFKESLKKSDSFLTDILKEPKKKYLMVYHLMMPTF